MKKTKNLNGEWTIELGNHGWMINPVTNKYDQIIFTNQGIFYNGQLLAQGKLQINSQHDIFKD